MSEEFKVEIVNPEKSFLAKEDVTEVIIPINVKLKLRACSMKSLRTRTYNFGKIASDYLKSLVNRLTGMLVYPQFQCNSPW